MRLHHLEITAFGPFAETTHINFDALSDAGLFLLSGPTGAGKSSVLDAVCFALYGDVPGDRASAKRLRCDRADEGVPPLVVLEATLAGRRFRIERSPQWVRPKRRGAGTVQENARVVISEELDGDWQPLSTRLDETGHLVTRLLGLNLSQFCQLVMLPQGRFQAFLRARSEERHQLLQQVFRTSRFDQVEKWLRDRRLELRRRDDEHMVRVADLTSRASEVLEATPPTDWSDLPGLLVQWCDEGEQQAAATHARVTALRDRAHRTVTEAQRALDAGVDLARHLERRRSLEATQDALAAAEPEVAERRHELGLAERARPLSTLLQRREAAATQLIDAREAHEAAITALADLTAGRASSEDHGALRLRVTAGRLELERLRPQQERRTVLAREAKELEAALEALTELDVAEAERQHELPALLGDARADLAQAQQAAARVDGLQAQVDLLTSRRDAHLRAGALTPQVEAARDEVSAATDQLHLLKDHWLAIRERRLDAMAAEIAAGLVVGGSCPVCGSHDHPAPADAGPDAPDAAAERAARKRVDDHEVALEAHRSNLRDLEHQLATATAEAGAEPDAIADHLTRVNDDLRTTRELADHQESAQARIAALTQEQASITDAVAARAEDRRAQSALLERTHQSIESIDQQVAELLKAWQHDDIAQLGAQLQDWDAACVRVEDTLSVVARSEAAKDEAEALCLEAAHAAGFDGLDEVGRAVRSPEEYDHLRTVVTQHDAELEQVRRGLADVELTSLAPVTPPDVASLSEDHEAARQELESASGQLVRAHSRLDRIKALRAEVAEAVAQWQPLREEFDLTSSLASFVEGKSPDNRLRMRLSAYVLAHRLSQVVEAANGRLWPMSSQRYTLLHTGRRGAGETRGGLSLLVRDEWSGESRDPATLSGGEMFVVSLALALGLADVIEAEADGADVQTLFVDEGFGSLDSQTLDGVMDALDGLRDGGRVVGVVSHVAEMQTRIPAQLRIHKGRQGSHATVRVG